MLHLTAGLLSAPVLLHLSVLISTIGFAAINRAQDKPIPLSLGFWAAQASMLIGLGLNAASAWKEDAFAKFCQPALFLVSYVECFVKFDALYIDVAARGATCNDVIGGILHSILPILIVLALVCAAIPIINEREQKLARRMALQAICQRRT